MAHSIILPSLGFLVSATCAEDLINITKSMSAGQSFHRLISGCVHNLGLTHFWRREISYRSVSSLSMSNLQYLGENSAKQTFWMPSIPTCSELGELKENQCRNISELKAEFTLELAHEKQKVRHKRNSE